MDTAKRLADLKEYAETQVDIVNENLANAFTRLCQDVVADWQRRYPRHRFRIWEGHGLIGIDISPPLGWDKSREWEGIEYCSSRNSRGAIGALWREANAIQEACNLDLRVQFGLTKIVSPATGDKL